MSRFLVLALAIYGAAAFPFSKRGLDDQQCIDSIPPNADPGTVDKVYLAALARGANIKVLQATMETCLQESRCNNLNCGDQDSLGAFQQRPSMGWGTPDQIMDPSYAAGKFLEQAIPLAAANPGWSPDQIAQGVQRAELGNLYAQRFDWANQLINEAAGRTGKAPPGGGGGSNPPPPPPTGGNGGCSQSVTANPGDSCWAIANAHGISVGDFMSRNPSIDANCSNLKVGQQYCLVGGGGGGGSGGSCSNKVTANAGDSCWAIANAHGISVGDFMSKNPGIDANCSNLKIGQQYCL